MKRRECGLQRAMVFVCLLISLVFCGAVAFAEEESPVIDATRRWLYQVTEGSAAIVGYTIKPVGALIIPDTVDGYAVKGIGNGAFSYCYGITSVTLPNSLTHIGDAAFEWCISLTRVNLPAGVTNIGVNPFAHSRLTHINVSASNPVYAQIDGVLFHKQQRMLVSYPSVRKGSYTIPNGVRRVGDRAFNGCIGLTAITLPERLTHIGDAAFDGCIGLTGITVTEGSYAEEYVQGKGLAYVVDK